MTPQLAARTEAAIAVLIDLIQRGFSCVMAMSGGKDSTVVTMLVLEAIRRVQAAGTRQGTHCVSSSSTGVENPAMENHLLRMHDEIAAWVASSQLPVEIHLVKPSLASGFVVTVIGRGTLPRFPENGKHRTCSDDWKVKPQQRLATALREKALAAGHQETVTILGTRSEESAARAIRMAARGDNAAHPVRNDAGFLSLSLIADWTEGEVWEFLAAFNQATPPFQSFTDNGASIGRMLELYRDGNEGTCGMFLGDGKKAPCGSRFGCAVCTITGERDKSMESMLADGKYAHLQGLNDFRNLLVATQHDMSRRELVGRTISEAGYAPIRPDVYNLLFRQALLRYALTLDAVERDRAEQLEADIITGRVADTPETRQLAEPQFELVSLEQLALIDFHHGMHHYAAHAFPALAIWYDVNVLGRRYPVPKLARVEPVKIPEKRWYKVGRYDAEAPADGLFDYNASQWNRYRHPQRPMQHRVIDGQKTAWFETGSGLGVNAEEACAFITCTYPEKFCESLHHGGLDGTRYWLNEGIVILPEAMASRYQHMARRAQYFARLQDRLNMTPAELDKHLVEASITDAEHETLLAQSGQSGQAQLFDLAA